MANTVWKGQLTFGLVSFPVRLMRAARKDRIPLRYVRQGESLPSKEEFAGTRMSLGGQQESESVGSDATEGKDVVQKELDLAKRFVEAVADPGQSFAAFAVCCNVWIANTDRPDWHVTMGHSNLRR